jgi:hypothetical protein
MGTPEGGTRDFATAVAAGAISAAALVSQGPAASTGSSEATAFLGGFNAALSATAFDGTVVFEKTYDGGQTWITISQDAAGTPASYALNWASPTTTSLAMAEVEPSVYWRIRCSVYNSGGLTYRLSQGGGFVFTSYPAIGGAL